MRDVVGDLLQAPHQRLDTFQHDVEVDGEPIEFVADARDRKAPGEIAGHDALCRVGDGVETLEHAARDEETTRKPQHDDERERAAYSRDDDLAHARALFKIAPDQQPESGGQLSHAYQRTVLGSLLFVEAAIDGFR